MFTQPCHRLHWNRAPDALMSSQGSCMGHACAGICCDRNRELSFEVRKMEQPRQVIDIALKNYLGHDFGFNLIHSLFKRNQIIHGSRLGTPSHSPILWSAWALMIRSFRLFYWKARDQRVFLSVVFQRSLSSEILSEWVKETQDQTSRCWTKKKWKHSQHKLWAGVNLVLHLHIVS